MITLYTIDCPKCIILEKKLLSKNISFDKCYDIDKMRKLGISQTPYLQIDDNLLDFAQAVKWINNF